MALSFPPADLAKIAQHASQLAKIIRDWLPFDGESHAKVHNWKTADSWFSLAADNYAECERIRNPDGLPFIERGGFYNGPQDAGPFWFELCYALDAIAGVYRWQGLSDGSGTSCSFAWRETIPEIPSGVLKRLERAAAGLQNVAGSYMPATTEPAASEPPSIPVVRTFSEWQKAFEWSPSTWGRRRTDFPECFTDVPGENACSIRERELSLWLASAENKNRSPFEKP